MASTFMRFFETVPPTKAGTVLTMSYSAQQVVEAPAFQEFVTRYELELEEVEPEHFICINENSTQPMSWREDIISPSLDISTRLAFAGLLVTLVDSGHNSTYVIDCSANPREKYRPVIASS